jgi:hypothetical protein
MFQIRTIVYLLLETDVFRCPKECGHRASNVAVPQPSQRAAGSHCRVSVSNMSSIKHACVYHAETRKR